tara:strand:- start:42 stop:587 length:546 start_codon:yes stop_codon:yes gene_type:complete
MRKKVRKFKGGGMDAGAGSDFKSPSGTTAVNKGSDHSHTRFETGSGYYGETPTNTGNNTTGNAKVNNVTTNQKTSSGFKIPVIGPLTAGLRIIQNLTTGQKKTKHPFSANTIKQIKPKTIDNVGGGGGQQLCPDGTFPPCKSPVTQIKKPVTNPNTFLSGFQSYDDGGEVVISSNVDKSLL